MLIEKTKHPKAKPVDESKLTFGDLFTDHMVIMEYDEGIVPYGPISLDPAAMILHYGQEVFEGMKAYRAVDGRILLFRPEENFKRLNLSNERLCIPLVDVEKCVELTKQLLILIRTGYHPLLIHHFISIRLSLLPILILEYVLASIIIL